MRRNLLTLGQVLRRSFLILSLMIFLLSSPFIFVQPPAYAVEGVNQMVRPEDKVRQTSQGEEKRSHLDVEAQEVIKGAGEEAKVMGKLLTGKRPSGESAFKSGK